jgi:hypothetical protein
VRGRGKPRDWMPIESAPTKVEQSLTKLFGVVSFLAWGRLNPRRTAMKLQLIAIAATVTLASGIGVASAADSQAMSKTSPSPAMQSMAKNSPSMAKDSLSLTRSQERTAWRDLSKQAANQTAPANFTATVGATIPGDIALRSVPANVSARVSSLKPYDYVRLQDKLLIVNPGDKKIVDVISRRA